MTTKIFGHAPGMQTYMDQDKERAAWQQTIKERDLLIKDIITLGGELGDHPKRLPIDEIRTIYSPLAAQASKERKKLMKNIKNLGGELGDHPEQTPLADLRNMYNKLVGQANIKKEQAQREYLLEQLQLLGYEVKKPKTASIRSLRKLFNEIQEGNPYELKQD